MKLEQYYVELNIIKKNNDLTNYKLLIPLEDAMHSFRGSLLTNIQYNWKGFADEKHQTKKPTKHL